MKKKFREMHEQMQTQQTKQQDFYQPADNQKTSSASSSEDYIDFEEIK